MKVRFIGNKNNYHDSVRGVGLLWNHGEIKDVTPQVAEIVSRFPTVWEVIRGDVLKKGATGKKAKKEAEVPEENLIGSLPKRKVERVLPVINFHVMNKAALIEYTQRYYNESLNQNKSEAEVRRDAIEVFNRKENERIDEEEEKERLEEEQAEKNMRIAKTEAV